MEYADNYFRSMAKMTTTANKRILRKSWSITHCDHMGNHSALDVGCGDGSSTVQVLKHLLGNDVDLEASDISDSMIKYAKLKHVDEGIKFFTWDVRDDVLVRQMIGKYDHVYSFFCLQYVQDQRKALSNIYDILKPGGSFFFAMLTQLPFYEAFRKLALYPTWGPYLKEEDISLCSAPYQHERDPVQAYTDVMVECGFQNVRVKRSSQAQRLESWENFIGLAKFGDQFSERLPKELRDYLEELKNVEGFVSEKKDKYDQPYLGLYDGDAYGYFISYGMKPIA